MGKEIRKDIRKARHNQRINELKEKLWYDIKKHKKSSNLTIPKLETETENLSHLQKRRKR